MLTRKGKRRLIEEEKEEDQASETEENQEDEHKENQEDEETAEDEETEEDEEDVEDEEELIFEEEEGDLEFDDSSEEENDSDDEDNEEDNVIEEDIDELELDMFEDEEEIEPSQGKTPKQKLDDAGFIYPSDANVFFTQFDFPEGYTSGPNDYEQYLEFSPTQVLALWFKPVWIHARNHTNIRIEKYNEENPEIKQPINIVTLKEIKNYLCLFFAAGSVKFNRVRNYWDQRSTSVGLFGNKFFRSTMRQRRFEELRRFFTIRTVWMTKFFNLCSAKYWNPYTSISIDDNIELWTGKFGQKKIVSGKADKTGHVCWEAVDDHLFIFVLTWEYDIRHNSEDVISITQKRLRVIEHKLPSGPFILYIDAGDFGCLANAKYLDKKGRQFVMCVRGNRDSYIWNHLHKDIEPYHWTTVCSDIMVALSYQPRVNKKYINFLTNINDIEAKRLVWSKELKEHIEVDAPQLLLDYVKGHIFVDAVKNSTNQTRPRFRNNNHWRSRSYALLIKLKHNCYI